MKKREAYDLSFNYELTDFRFESIGRQGVILKAIEFRFYRKGRWNLAFGDVKGKYWTDDVVSDNGDMRKVLQTVANAVHLFLSRYPGRKVWIEPLSRKHKFLYNRIFQQKHEEIAEEFEVRGVLLLEDENELTEAYQPGKIYDAFILSLKLLTFEKQIF
ncbi:MAG: hypothetical protein AAB316_03715 [Bacteroidota bacterium]